MQVSADPNDLPTGETANNPIEAVCEPIDAADLHTAAEPNDDMPTALSESYTEREKTTMKALTDTLRDIEKTLATNSTHNRAPPLDSR